MGKFFVIFVLTFGPIFIIINTLDVIFEHNFTLCAADRPVLRTAGQRKEPNTVSFDRREKILTILREKGVVKLKELQIQFPQVSSMTLRRDLEYFEKLGEAVRIRGGARYIRNLDAGQEDVYALRAVKNPEGKSKIGKLAAKYVETGRSIFMDSGTTGMMFARQIPDLDLSILTSAPNVALEVSKRYKPNVTLIGGLINRSTLSVSGPQSQDFISQLNFDYAFLVASAFSPENGCTCGNYSECELKRSIIDKAKKTIMLVDSSKFGKSMPFTFATLDQIDLLITDQRPSDEILALAEQNQVTVLWE